MNEITDKTWVILTYGDMRLYVNEEMATKVKGVMMITNPPKCFQVEGNIIALASISGVFKASDIESNDKIKRGDWICKYGEWHTKKEECGHNLQVR